MPRPETYHDDPRIAATQAGIDLSEQIMPGFLAFHPMGALLGQECVRITASEFTSMIYSVQYRLPSYYRWLLYEADHTGAYRFHRIFLQHLQSGVSGQWLLKSPAHPWQLDTLLAQYPDALVVQTHRDPLNVISSITALTYHLRRMCSDESSITECAAQSYEEIVVGLEREMALRDDGAVPAGRVIDVQYTDFMNDPWTTIKDIYQRLDRELRPDAEAKMREFLAAHPNVPVMIIAVGSGERIGRVLPELGGLLRQPMFTLERVSVCKRDGEFLERPRALPMTDHQGLPLWQKLMVYTSESAHSGGEPIHRAILQRFRRREAPDGATVLRGTWGFHGNHRPHGDKLLSLSRRVPVVTIVVDTPANVAESFDVIDELTQGRALGDE